MTVRRRLGRAIRPLIPGVLLLILWELGALYLFDPQVDVNQPITVQYETTRSTDWTVILARIGRRIDARPLLAGHSSPLARIRSLLAQRAPAYAQADLTVDTSSLNTEQVTEQVAERLAPWLCQSWRYFLDHVAKLSDRYGGKYVAVCGDRIVGSGQTQLEAYRHAGRRLAEKGDAGIYYIPLPEESQTVL